jgi:predicted PP-loop superfamily ATPase
LRIAVAMSGAWDVATPAIASGIAWHGILLVQTLAIAPAHLRSLVSDLSPAAERLQPHLLDLVALGLRLLLIQTAL